MKAIELQPEFLIPKPSAYVDKTLVMFQGIDGQERCPWTPELNIEDLLQLLED